MDSFSIIFAGVAFFFADAAWSEKDYTWAVVMVIIGLLNLALAVMPL